jgi:UDP-N-acetylmuramoyl-tripeptide--D-alanyl-D-alanine ligase
MSAPSLADAAHWAQGQLVGVDAPLVGVSTDTRTLCQGELFVALRGPHFDGHDYLDVAAARGAAGALVQRGHQAVLSTIEVDDTRLGLGRLARGWRLQSDAKVIGLTGSNGKTTLKEMIAAILTHNGATLATHGNLNNDIGVPLTLCRLRDERFAVIEMGANHRGEIDYLTGLVKPDVAVLNNAGRAHLEGFGGLEGVARGKAEIMNGLGPNGVFVFNGDDRFAELWRELADGRTQRTFGVKQPADVSSPDEAIRVVWRGHRFETRFPVHCAAGQIEVGIQLAGEHNRMNALAAVAASLEVGASLDTVVPALAAIKPVPGRLCPMSARGGARLIDDSYNANPDSVLAALRVLKTAPGRRTMVLGDLAELGDEAVELHRQIGRSVAEAGIERLYTVGDLSAHAGQAFTGEHKHFDERAALIDYVGAELGSDDSMLVKGSRSARMDELVAAWGEKGAVC